MESLMNENGDRNRATDQNIKTEHGERAIKPEPRVKHERSDDDHVENSEKRIKVKVIHDLTGDSD